MIPKPSSMGNTPSTLNLPLNGETHSKYQKQYATSRVARSRKSRPEPVSASAPGMSPDVNLSSPAGRPAENPTRPFDESIRVTLKRVRSADAEVETSLKKSKHIEEVLCPRSCLVVKLKLTREQMSQIVDHWNSGRKSKTPAPLNPSEWPTGRLQSYNSPVQRHSPPSTQEFHRPSPTLHSQEREDMVTHSPRGSRSHLQDNDDAVDASAINVPATNTLAPNTHSSVVEAPNGDEAGREEYSEYQSSLQELENHNAAAKASGWSSVPSGPSDSTAHCDLPAAQGSDESGTPLTLAAQQAASKASDALEYIQTAGIGQGAPGTERNLVQSTDSSRDSNHRAGQTAVADVNSRMHATPAPTIGSTATPTTAQAAAPGAARPTTLSNVPFTLPSSAPLAATTSAPPSGPSSASVTASNAGPIHSPTTAPLAGPTSAIAPNAPIFALNEAGTPTDSSTHSTKSQCGSKEVDQLLKHITIRLYVKHEHNQKVEPVRAFSLEELKIATSRQLFEHLEEEVKEHLYEDEQSVRADVNWFSNLPTAKLMIGFVMTRKHVKFGRRDRSWDQLLGDLQDHYNESGKLEAMTLEATVLAKKGCDDNLKA